MKHLLAFSCKCCHFCPTCHQKQLVELGQWLYTEVFKKVTPSALLLDQGVVDATLLITKPGLPVFRKGQNRAQDLFHRSFRPVEGVTWYVLASMILPIKIALYLTRRQSCHSTTATKFKVFYPFFKDISNFRANH